MPDAWILPKNGQSTLWVRSDATHYRHADRTLVEKGPVAMPPQSPHWFDPAQDILVYADKGRLHIVRGLSQQTKPEIVKLPGTPAIHALFVVDDVVFVGSDSGKNMLGYVDLRGPLQWRSIPVAREINWTGKGIDGFARRGSKLVAIDDIVLPRYLFLLDISDPRNPRALEHRDLPAHSSGERIRSVVSNDDIVVMLSSSGNHGAASLHIAFYDLESLAEYATLTVQHIHSFRRWSSSSYEFHKLALIDQTLVIAADNDGLALLPVPPIPSEKPQTDTKTHVDPETGVKYSFLAHAPPLAEQRLQFVKVEQGPVVDVVALDKHTAGAIVSRPGKGFFRRDSLDSVWVALPQSGDS